MQDILTHFPSLTPRQREQFEALDPLYREWNSKINLISRKDIDNLYEHHVLHSLAIADVIHFRPETSIMDAGTGGGFPGIPLAILFPQCSFLLVDSTHKKINACEQIASALGLTNVTTQWARLEDVTSKHDFVVARALATLPELVALIRKNISRTQRNALPNGLICLKGGQLAKETRFAKALTEITDISDFLPQPYFQEKKIVYISL